MTDIIKKSRHSSKRSKKQSAKKQSANKNITKKHTHSSLDKRITRKQVRDFEVSRVQAILDILPAFTKFYDKLSRNDLTAIKYYKGYGSFFQSNLLTAKPAKPTKPDEKKKFYVPFHYGEEISLRRDLLV
jgi:hypothetical protein